MAKKKKTVKKVTVPKEMIDRFEEDAQDNLANIPNPFTELLIDKKLKKFEAIILREIPVNLFYSKEDIETFCWSLGGTMPEESIKMQSGFCSNCPQKNKDCLTTKRVILFSEKQGVIVTSLYGDSLVIFNDYLMKLYGSMHEVALTPYFAVKTEVSVDKKSKTLKLSFKQKRYVMIKTYDALKEYRNSEPIETLLNSHILKSEEEVARKIIGG